MFQVFFDLIPFGMQWTSKQQEAQQDFEDEFADVETFNKGFQFNDVLCMKQIAVDQQKRNAEWKEEQSDYKRHF